MKVPNIGAIFTSTLTKICFVGIDQSADLFITGIVADVSNPATHPLEDYHLVESALSSTHVVATLTEVKVSGSLIRLLGVATMPLGVIWRAQVVLSMEGMVTCILHCDGGCDHDDIDVWSTSSELSLAPTVVAASALVVHRVQNKARGVWAESPEKLHEACLPITVLHKRCEGVSICVRFT
jgi:hypothetical protein